MKNILLFIFSIVFSMANAQKVLTYSKAGTVTIDCYQGGFLPTAECELCKVAGDKEYHNGLIIKRGSQVVARVSSRYNWVINNDQVTFYWWASTISKQASYTVKVGETGFLKINDLISSIRSCQTATGGATGVAGGQLSGSYPNPTIAPLGATTAGQILTWNGTSWVAGNPSISNVSHDNTLTGSGTVVSPLKTDTSIIATTASVTNLASQVGQKQDKIQFQNAGSNVGTSGGVTTINATGGITASYVSGVLTLNTVATPLLNEYPNEHTAAAAGVAIGQDYIASNDNTMGIKAGNKVTRRY